MQNASVTTDPAPRGPARRPRLSGGLTRSRILAILQERGGPLSTHELASDLGLHPNSVREQLDRLVADGLARRVPASPSGRGRPGLRYLAIQQPDEAAPYRDLARALADELDRLPDPGQRAVSAGERWGRATVKPATAALALPGRPSPTGPVESLVAVLEAGGFAPEPAAEGEPIRLRRCPFGTLARERRSVVCGIHLGLMRGILAELGAPTDAVRLEPFVEPDLCLAHVGSAAGDAATPRPGVASRPGIASGTVAASRPSGARAGRRRTGSTPGRRSFGS